MKLLKFLMPLGMIGAAAYMLHALLGPALWPAYDPMVMDLSTLTADSAPHARLLRVFTIVYGVCLILFSLGVVIRNITPRRGPGMGSFLQWPLYPPWAMRCSRCWGTKRT